MDSNAPRSSGSHALSLTTIAGKPAPTWGHAHAETVGASLLAMDFSAPRLSSSPALSLTTIAGKPAPTGDRAHAPNQYPPQKMALPRRLFSLWLLLALPRHHQWDLCLTQIQGRQFRRLTQALQHPGIVIINVRLERHPPVIAQVHGPIGQQPRRTSGCLL